MGRLDMHTLQEFVRLARMGTGFRAIARMLRISPNTEREYRKALDAAGLLVGDPNDLPEPATLLAVLEKHRPTRLAPQQESSVERWATEVKAMHELGAKPVAIFDRLRLEHKDFTGSLSAIKRMWRRLEAEHGPRAEAVAIPVETAPGQVAQVDFGDVGKLYDPASRVLRRAYVFVMVLGYSRHMFVHHARKGGHARAGQALRGSSERGSSELHAWGDSNLNLRRDGERLLMSIEHRAAAVVIGPRARLGERVGGLKLHVRDDAGPATGPDPEWLMEAINNHRPSARPPSM